MATNAKPPSGNKRQGIIAAVGHAGPYGLLGLIALVLEAALLAWFAQASSGIERGTAGVLMATIMIFLIGAVVFIERNRERTSIPATAQALDKPGISPTEIAGLPAVVTNTPEAPRATSGEIYAALDRSYAIAWPPAGWSIREATIESDLKQKLGVGDNTNLGLPTSSVLVLQYGDKVSFVPQPGRTRVNGRRIPLLLSENLFRGLRITAVPRRQPPFFVEKSLYDNSLTSISLLIQTQIASLVTLTPGILPKTNRSMLIAELVQEFENIIVDNREVEKLRTNIRVHAVRGDLFDYIFAVTNYRMGDGLDATAERVDADVLALLNSFSIASVADREAAERAEILRADQGFETFLSENGAGLYQAQLAVAGLRLRNVSYDTPEGLAEAMSILRPFRAFASMLPDKNIGDPDLWVAMDAADHGDSVRLRDYLHENLKEEEDADSNAEAQGPGVRTALPSAVESRGDSATERAAVLSALESDNSAPTARSTRKSRAPKRATRTLPPSIGS